MTKIIVDTKKLINNCKRVLKATKDYKYKIAVTKGNGYGHDTKIATKAFLKAGFKIFGLARYSECLETYEVVKGMKDITILSLSVVENENIKNCIKYGFIIPITSIEQIESYIQQKTIKNLKVQIALNTGMNRIGFNDKQKLLQAFNMLNKHGAEIVGVFSHVFENDSVELSIKQFDKYEELISIIPNWKKIPMHSIRASWGIANLYRIPKRNWETTCRPGTSLYGVASYEEKSDLLNAVSVVSEVAHINIVKKNGMVGYGGTYTVKDDIEYIATVPCGWGDGIPRDFNTGSVYINDKLCPIVGRISMDSFGVKVPANTKINDKVYVFKDFKHACTFLKNPNDIANVIAVVCNFSSKRVPRIEK